PVVIGDARESATLSQAGLGRSRAVIACINNDLLNIEIALAARTLVPGLPVVLRAFDEDLDAGVERVFGKDSTFSTSALSAPTLAAAVLSRGIDYVLPASPGSEQDSRHDSEHDSEHDAQQLAITHLTVPARSSLAVPVAKFEELHHVRMLALSNKNGSPATWSTASQLKGGMRVDVLGTLSALEQLQLEYEAQGARKGQRAALAESLRAALS